MSGKWFALGAVAGIAVTAFLIPADPSQCCERVAFGARDKIAGLAGPFSGLVKGVFDVSGLTKILPGLLDRLGVPTDV